MTNKKDLKLAEELFELCSDKSNPAVIHGMQRLEWHEIPDKFPSGIERIAEALTAQRQQLIEEILEGSIQINGGYENTQEFNEGWDACRKEIKSKLTE